MSDEITQPTELSFKIIRLFTLASSGHSLRRIIATLVFFLSSNHLSAAQLITTYAGNGQVAQIFGGFKFPAKIIRNSSNDLYVSDSVDNVIWKIPRNKQMVVVAGATAASGQYAGDGGPAVKASLKSPLGMAMDKAGNLFLADAGNNVIRKISVDGIITTVAGRGTAGFSGDGGVATQAEFNSPNDVAIDSSGNLYISDYANNRIRKVSADGIVTTIAGNGDPGFSGDNGPAAGAQLNHPAFIDLDDAGNLYLADSKNNRIRKILRSGVIVTVAGDGVAGYSGDGGAATRAHLNVPIGVTVDAAGNLYIGDFGNARIRRVSSTNIITTVAGDGLYADSGGANRGDYGLAINASIGNASSAVILDDQSIFICNSSNLDIKKISASGIIITYIGNGAGNIQGDGGAAISAEFNLPVSIAVDNYGSVYVADSFVGRIRKISGDSTISSVAGIGTAGWSGDGGPATDAAIYSPQEMAFDAQNNLYFADSSARCVRRVSGDGIIATVAGICGTEGNDGDGGPATAAHMGSVYGVAVDSTGAIYVSDQSNNVVRKISSSGSIFTLKLGTSLSSPRGLAVDRRDNLYVADYFNSRVLKVSLAGSVVVVAGGSNATALGDGGPATSAMVASPMALAVDASGNLYIADTYVSRIRKVSLDGMITTMAGSFHKGYSGDGSAATSASLGNPFGVAVDGVGNVYIADTTNYVVRKVYADFGSASDVVNLNQHGLTGIWYNPATSGQGFIVESDKDWAGPGQALLAMGWYTFDVAPGGGQRWYTMSTPTSAGDTSAIFAIYGTYGGNFNAPPHVFAQQVGQGTISFKDCMSANLTFSFNDGRTGAFPLYRLDPNVTCSTAGDNDNPSQNYLLSGAWYDPSTSGQGFFFDFNPKINLMAATWYTFAPNGSVMGGPASQRWYTIQDNSFVPGTMSKGGLNIYETTGGTFNNGKINTGPKVGVASLTINGCNSLTLSYAFTGGTNLGKTGAINLQHVGFPPVGCAL